MKMKLTEALCKLCQNDHMSTTEIKEGKIELISTIDGLFKVNREKLFEVNRMGEMMIATRNGNTVVHSGDHLAGMRIIPLVIKKEKMEEASKITETPILEVKPLYLRKQPLLLQEVKSIKDVSKIHLLLLLLIN